MNKKYQLIEIAVKCAVIALFVLFMLSAIGCKTIEYRDRPAPNYIKQGCKVPEPAQYEIIEHVFEYQADLIATIKECDARMNRITGQTTSD